MSLLTSRTNATSAYGARISGQRLQRRFGQRLRVFVDSVDEHGAIACREADVPEIDGVMRIDSPADLRAGEWVEVKIPASDVYDLHGRPIEP